MKDIGNIKFSDPFGNGFVLKEALDKHIPLKSKNVSCYGSKSSINKIMLVITDTTSEDFADLYSIDENSYDTSLVEQIQSYISKYTRNYKINKLLI